MGFQPFGYRFEIASHLPPAEAKAAIRNRKTRIFDVQNGARGWIAGPFVCLWFSAFDRHGPMLFGLISADNFGTRVRGRAGSDLNGVLMFSLVLPLVALLAFLMIVYGQASARQLVVLALVFLGGGPLVYWFAHKDRKNAEPLVRFLRQTLAPSGRRPQSSAPAPKVRTRLRLILGEDALEGQLTAEAIQSALMRVGNRDFMIIESGPQDYLQTACRDGGYILELRKGGPNEHYCAVRSGGALGGTISGAEAFTFEEILEAMTAYAAGSDMPRFVLWQHLEMPT